MRADDLRDALRARLEPVGWEMLDSDSATVAKAESGDSLARLTRPLDDGFVATAAVCGSSQRSTGLRVVQLCVGISWVPLNRLLPLLGAPELHELVREGVLPRAVDDATPDQIEITTAAQLAAVADQLARLVVDRSEALGKRYASVDALVGHLGESGELQGLAALSAAAGRFEEARAALDALAEEALPDRLFVDEHVRHRETRRFRRQLLRWINSNGSVTLPTEQPPPRQAQDPRSTRAVLTDAWNIGIAKSGAIKAAKRAADGKTRNELRATVEDELARRGVTEGPIQVEQHVDALLDPEAHRREGFEVLRRFGRGIHTAIRDRTFPDLTVPSWIAPPGRAVYAVSRDTEAPQAAVCLDEDATSWLARAVADMPTLAGLPIGFDAWLDWDEHNDTRELAVHLGQRRVGMLAPPAVAALRPVMDAAAVRDELPYTPAYLVAHPEAGYILQIQLPTHTQRD